MNDASGHCDRGLHDKCTGKYLRGTGHHWYCACPCHPDPPHQSGTDHVKAMKVWRIARSINQQQENTQP